MSYRENGARVYDAQRGDHWWSVEVDGRRTAGVVRACPARGWVEVYERDELGAYLMSTDGWGYTDIQRWRCPCRVLTIPPVWYRRASVVRLRSQLRRAWRQIRRRRK